MDFLRSQWVPARSVHPEFRFKTPEAAAATRRAPMVVQIPVHFVGSETARSASALKIQKVFRGFMVRKSVKKIVAIKREVEAVEARVSQMEVTNLIRKDGKERLEVNETLMALLFKLDAVSGCVDSGIRVCRKAVIRKAIALQERVDSIANDQTETLDDGKVVVQEPREEEALTQTECSSEDDASERDQIQVNDTNNDGKVEVEESRKQAADYDESASNTCNKSEEDDDGCGSSSSEEYEFVERNIAENCDEKAEIQVDVSLMEEVEVEVDEERRSVEMGHDEKENGKKKESKELLKIMVEENGKLMKMMTELFEKNEAQARMLNTLTHRLEQLEKAFVCEQMKRTKKRHCS